MIVRAAGLVALSLLAACKPDEAPPTPPPPPVEATLKASALCAQVFGGLTSELEGACSADEKAGSPYRYLAGRVDALEHDCVASLEPEVDAGHVVLHAKSTEACVEALRLLGKKRRLALGSIGEVAACRALVEGTQADGAPCAIDAGCKDGLLCDATSAGAPGVCRPRAATGARCPFRTGPHAGWLGRASCASSNDTCRGTPSRTFPLGFDAIDPALPHPAALAVSSASAPIFAPPFVRRGLDQVTAGEASTAPDVSDPEAGLGTPLSGRGGGERGPPIRAPKLKLGTMSVSGTLPIEVVRRVVRQNFGRFRLCYEQALKNDPETGGTWKLAFVVDPKGDVGSVRSEAATDARVGDGTLSACLAKAIERLGVPTPESGAVVVRLDLELAPPPPDTRVPPPAPTCAPVSSSGACLDDPDCREGLHCAGGRCREDFAGLDQACDETSDCEPLAYCAFATPGEGTARPSGLCKLLKAAGARCASSLQCEGICDAEGVCRAFCEPR